MKFRDLLAKPLAIVPMSMSLVALLIVSGHVAMLGSVREVDEGADAHLFQLVMFAQVPLIAYFAYRWLPRAPRSACGVLALQAAAIVLALAPVAYFNL